MSSCLCLKPRLQMEFLFSVLTERLFTHTTQVSASWTLIRCPTIQLNSDTNYPELGKTPQMKKAQQPHKTAPSSDTSRQRCDQVTHISAQPTKNSGVPMIPHKA